MKNVKLLLTFLCVFFVTTTNAFSIMIVGGPYDGTDVGIIDILIDSTNTLPNSNPTTETDWVNSVIAPQTATFQVKHPPVGDDWPLYSTDVADVYAVYLPTPPESDYFLVKNARFWALFDNSTEIDWGVINAVVLPDRMNIGDVTVSHVTRFDGDTPGGPSVPEPTTMLLLGTGMIGMAGVGRKRFKK